MNNQAHGAAAQSAATVRSMAAALALAGMLSTCLLPAGAQAQGGPVEPVLSMVRKEQPAVLDTLRDLVNIESGSHDKAGLDRLPT